MSEETAAPAPTAPQDVTDEFVDLAPEDRIYRTAEGWLIKVKVLWDDTQDDELGSVAGSFHGAERFFVTGSIVGLDGKALRRADGRLAVYNQSHRHHHHADALQDPELGLEIARLACVEATVTAEKHHQMVSGYRPGFTSVSAQRARKAAEAAAAAISQEQTP